MLKNDEPDRLLIPNRQAMQIIGVQESKFWRLKREAKFIVVGSGKASRAYLPSVLSYVEQLAADAKAAMDAKGGRPDPKRSGQMRAAWAARKANRKIAAE
jgi:hypothetical protein